MVLWTEEKWASWVTKSRYRVVGADFSSKCTRKPSNCLDKTWDNNFPGDKLQLQGAFGSIVTTKRGT